MSTRHRGMHTTVLQAATQLTLLPRLPGCRLKTAVASTGRPVLLPQLESRCVSARHHPKKCTWTVWRTTTAQMARLSAPLASSPAHHQHGCTQHMVISANAIDAQNGRRPISVSRCSQHVANTIRPCPGGQRVLERRTLLLELCGELFKQSPGDESPK